MPIKLYFYKEDETWVDPEDRFIPIAVTNFITLIAQSVTSEQVATITEYGIRNVKQESDKKPISLPMGYSGINIELSGVITDSMTAAFFLSLRPDMLCEIKREDYYDSGAFVGISTYHQMYVNTDASIWWEINSFELSREQGQVNFWQYSLSLTQQHYKDEGYR
jgi:hypothetical protein